jgi:hypothetical protein
MKVAIVSRLLLPAAASLLVFTRAHAVDYTVDNANPQAADSNPGTEAAPWAAIQHAADSVAGGDTVTVKDYRREAA